VLSLRVRLHAMLAILLFVGDIPNILERAAFPFSMHGLLSVDQYVTLRVEPEYSTPM
jgi:hypothetical protein